MLLSSSTDLYQDAREKKHAHSIPEAIRAFHEAGFTHVDLTLTEHCYPGSPFAGERWQFWMEEIEEALAETGMRVNQTHTVFYLHRQEEETLRFYEKMADRCLEASARVGAGWTVMHILRTVDLDIPADRKEEALVRNAAYFAPYGEKARRAGIGIAIENGLSGFFHSAGELLALLDLLHDDAFGLCWDTGHANLTGQEQASSIRCMGNKLRCLHINDNHGLKDEHLLPFMGTVDFPPILEAIRTLEEQPILTFESRGSTRTLPVSAQMDLLRAAVHIGRVMNGEQEDGV